MGDAYGGLYVKYEAEMKARKAAESERDEARASLADAKAEIGRWRKAYAETFDRAALAQSECARLRDDYERGRADGFAAGVKAAAVQAWMCGWQRRRTLALLPSPPPLRAPSPTTSTAAQLKTCRTCAHEQKPLDEWPCKSCRPHVNDAQGWAPRSPMEPLITNPILHAGWCAKNQSHSTLDVVACNCGCDPVRSPTEPAAPRQRIEGEILATHWQPDTITNSAPASSTGAACEACGGSGSSPNFGAAYVCLSCGGTGRSPSTPTKEK